MPNLRTQTEIRDQILQDMAVGGLTADGVGTTNRTVAEAISHALAEGHYLLGLLLDAFFLERASGEFLDLRVRDRLPDGRKPGTQATGRLTFSRSAPAIAQITVPVGTTVITPDGTVELVTTEAGIIRAGDTYVTVSARATSVGAAGNLPAGTTLKVKGLGVQGIEAVTVATPGFTGGTDRETDEQLRERYLFELRNQRRSGSAADYRAWAMAVNGVTDATVIPLARGPGTVDILITTGGGIPDQELVDAVQAAINAVKPAVDDARVLAPAVTVVNVQVRVTAAGGHTVGGLAPAVLEAIRSYLTGLAVGEPVLVARLIVAAMSVPGVANCTVEAPAGDVVVGQTEKAMPGIIEVV